MVLYVFHLLLFRTQTSRIQDKFVQKKKKILLSLRDFVEFNLHLAASFLSPHESIEMHIKLNKSIQLFQSYSQSHHSSTALMLNTSNSSISNSN